MTVARPKQEMSISVRNIDIIMYSGKVNNSSGIGEMAPRMKASERDLTSWAF